MCVSVGKRRMPNGPDSFLTLWALSFGCSADILSISNRYRLMLAHGLASKLQATAMLTAQNRKNEKKVIHENAPTTKLVNQNQCSSLHSGGIVCAVSRRRHRRLSQWNILNSCHLRYLARFDSSRFSSASSSSSSIRLPFFSFHFLHPVRIYCDPMNVPIYLLCFASFAFSRAHILR